jgi:hypothetical protein
MPLFSKITSMYYKHFLRGLEILKCQERPTISEVLCRKPLNYCTTREALFYETTVVCHCTIIVPVVLYGCETWSPTLRNECRLRVFENRILRRIFEPKRDEVTGEWRRLHNKELYALYSSTDMIRLIKSRRLRWAGHVTLWGEERCIQGSSGET